MKRIMILFLLLVVGVMPIVGQGSDCATPVQDVISVAAERCGNLSSGEACYGHGVIETVFVCETAPEFDSPGDKVASDSLFKLRLGMNHSPEAWNLALMRIPGDVLDLDTVFVLFGDVEISNEASSFAEQGAQVDNNTDVRSGPGSHYASIATVAAGDRIKANACNCTGNWLRVKLDTGQIGWIAARNVTIIGDAEAMPDVTCDTPIYNSMQAFSFQNGSSQTSCTDVPESGILIQVPAGMEEMQLQINAVKVVLSSTIFVQSQPGGVLTIEVFDGSASVTVTDFTARVAVGARAVISMTEDNTPDGIPYIEPYTIQDVANLPLSLLPESVDPTAPLDLDMPMIVGMQACAVVADREATVCPLHFLNPDGDAIVSMDVQFVSAPQGEWAGSVRQPPEQLEGDNVSGTLVWDSTCSLSTGVNFIGPVKWSITITDEQGHVSDPFEAQFNCVEG